MASNAPQSGPEFDEERRVAERGCSNVTATLRQQRRPNEIVHLTDITPIGCGFEARSHFAADSTVWLRLPGLETWSATVTWFEDGKGGLSFTRPLHPMVAARYLSGSSKADN